MQPQYQRLTDDQWEVIKHFLNWQRKRKIDLREVVNAILWITRTGAQWRNLDSSFPPWSAVYYYFARWTKECLFERMCHMLNMLERLQRGREAEPSLVVADSQSVKLAPMIYEDRGLDGNKWINGRKRQLLVDVLGRIWKAYVHAANLSDGSAGVPLLEDWDLWGERLRKILGDKAYRGTFAQAVAAEGLTFEVPERPEGTKGFVVEAKRWVVERTFAWLNHFRRVVMDYEHTTESSQSFLYLANISMVIWRLDCEAV